MEKRTTSEKTVCRLSIAAALALVVGGIFLCGYLLGKLPDQWGMEVWKFLLYQVAGLLPIVAGGVWLTKLYRNGRRREGCSGTSGAVVFGIILVAVGTLLFIFSTGMVLPQWRHILISWQMLVVLAGVVQLCKAEASSGIILLSVGTFFLIPRIDAVFPGTLAVPADFKAAYWPILLVISGLAVIVGMALQRSGKGRTTGSCGSACRSRHPHSRSGMVAGQGVSAPDGTINYNYIFSGAEQVFLEPVFRGGSIRTVFGGMELDLRHTALPEGTTYLRVDALFGGVEVKAPADWNIVMESHSVFGGVGDERHAYKSPEQDGRQLVIVANCAFGGCSVE